MAAKPAHISQSTTTGTRQALALFARFKGESTTLPSWATDIFNPGLPGSFSHFYDTMSLGKLQVRGEVAPRVYESAQPASAYLSVDPAEQGRFGQFAREILRQADQDLDFAQFDNDGPDGVPNSGDDDGVMDAVFLVLDRIPTGFLLAEATGIGNLGFGDPFATADVGAGGHALRILSQQGTLQQGRSFAEAVGAMCHEYGHILGLPDLYDMEFFRKPDADPEEDSAGVGAWCLMGWGASGWNGNDGPNSFCAWSRMKLGWANVEEIAQPQEELHLGEVGRAGAVYQIPVDAKEYFLLEYRTRARSYYDRDIPGEGLLIWHITAKGAVDLECADGRWQEAGYPQGQTPDPQTGGDNLDFWAHDEGYTKTHNGNLGDEADPFDGLRFRDFTPDTNPSSYSLDGTRSVRIEDIRFEAGQALAQVRTDSLRLEIGEVQLRDGDGNGVLSPGEQAALYFQLANVGGLTVPGVRAVLSTADSMLQIQRPEARFGAVEIGPRAQLLPGEAFPQVSLKADPKSNRQVKMALEVYSGEALLNRQEFNVTITSTFRWSGRVRDEAGNGVEGVQIYIYGTNTSSVTSSLDGVFQIDLVPGTYFIYVPHPSSRGLFSTGYNFTLLSALYSDLVLPTIYPITGNVRGPQDQPLEVTIEASTPRFDGKYYDGFAFSAKDGAYTLMLARGTYDLYVRSSSPDVPDRVLSSVHVAGPQTLDIDLQRGVRLSAQVADEEDKGSVLALYMVRFPDRRASVSSNLQTDSEGKGAVNVQPGMYLVRFIPPYFSHSPYLEMGSLFPVFADTTIQFRLKKGVEISGRVEDEGIEPFLNSRLIFVPQAPYSLFGVGIADDGTYTAQAPPGHCQVVFVGTDPGNSLQQRIGELSTQSSGTFDWTVPSGEPVVGKVVDGDGQRLAGIEVQALSVQTGVSSAARTQTDGVFSSYLQPGSYELTGVEQNASFFSLGTLEAPLTDTLRVQKPTGALLQGRVVDDQGHPIEQAVVLLTRDSRFLTKISPTYLSAPQIYQSGGLVAAAISGEEGVYQLYTQPGTYDLLLFPEISAGIGRVFRKMEVRGKRDQDLVLPTPERVYQVYGQIQERADQPGGELVLQFYHGETGVVAQFTDLGYRGYGAELPPGRYQVRAGLLGPVGGFQKVYEIGSVSIDRDTHWDINLTEATTAVAEEAAATPQHFSLDPNYPNPFNPSTTLRFTLPQAGEAELSIYNLLGQRVATLVRGVQEAGPQVLQWNGRDEQGKELASGVYFYRLQAGAQVETRKLLLLR